MAWCEVCEYENLGLSELHGSSKQNLNTTTTELKRETKMINLNACEPGDKLISKHWRK